MMGSVLRPFITPLRKLGASTPPLLRSRTSLTAAAAFASVAVTITITITAARHAHTILPKVYIVTLLKAVVSARFSVTHNSPRHSLEKGCKNCLKQTVLWESCFVSIFKGTR